MESSKLLIMALSFWWPVPIQEPAKCCLFRSDSSTTQETPSILGELCQEPEAETNIYLFCYFTLAFNLNFWVGFYILKPSIPEDGMSHLPIRVWLSEGQDVRIIHICCSRCLVLSCSQPQRKSWPSPPPNKSTHLPLLSHRPIPPGPPFINYPCPRFIKVSLKTLKYISGPPWTQIPQNIFIFFHPSQPNFSENWSILPHAISSPPLSTIAWLPHHPSPGHRSH